MRKIKLSHIMDLLYFAFSNSLIAPLPHLEDEFNQLMTNLLPRASRQHYFLLADPFSSIAKVAQTIAEYHDRIVLFHFSGHGGTDNLLLQEELARSEGLIELLGQCPRLKVVFLNGCSTDGLVDGLLKKGISLVIATSSKVDDLLASKFSKSFYRAMERGETVAQAFEIAKGEIQTNSPIEIKRGLFKPNLHSEEGQWGLFYQMEHPESINYKFPLESNFLEPASISPNDILTETLYQTLANHHDGVRELRRREEEGEYIEIGDKQKEILNALPIPIAEHLRKLMCPVATENEGFDKVSFRRLEQITTVFQMTSELLTFTLIAQLWENHLNNSDLPFFIPTDLQSRLKDFFHLSQIERKSFNHIPMIRQIRKHMDAININYFVQELSLTSQLFQDDLSFINAIEYLSFLRNQVTLGMIENREVPEMCRRAEQSLSYFLSKLGFQAKYTLASIKNIDIRKYRHHKDATYNHTLVKLMRVMGKLEVNQFVLKNFLDNKGVLLIKDDKKVRFVKNKKEFQGEELSYLNLSPFVIDKNAFEENTDISKLYIFDHFDLERGNYYFRHVKKPDEDSLLEVSATSKFEVVKEQFDAFCSQILGMN